MKIEDCEPSLRERIRQQLTADDRAKAQTRRARLSATLSQAEQPDAVAGIVASKFSATSRAGQAETAKTKAPSHNESQS